jgi:long-chain acyl-CoA synthetase
MLMNAALGSGARQILMERFDLEALFRAFRHYGAPFFTSSRRCSSRWPTHRASIARNSDTVRYALSAAAPLAPDVARRVEDGFGIRVIQAYGLTETGPASHHSPLEPERARLESVGVVMADTEQRVVDLETGDRVLAPGEIGEICIRGPQLMKGYWNAPRKPRERFGTDGCTAETSVMWTTEGYTFIVDRKKEMIKCRAFSVAPAELEATCSSIPTLRTAASSVSRTRMAARCRTPLSCRERDVRSMQAALTTFLRSASPATRRFGKWHFTDAIPRTPSGKILRRMLKERLTP